MKRASNSDTCSNSSQQAAQPLLQVSRIVDPEKRDRAGKPRAEQARVGGVVHAQPDDGHPPAARAQQVAKQVGAAEMKGTKQPAWGQDVYTI